jgi:hypothetical protein
MAEPDTLEAIRADFIALQARMKRLETLVPEQRSALEREMRAGFEAVEGNFKGIHARFDGLETELRYRFEQFEAGYEDISKRLDSLEAFLRSKLNGHDARKA